MRIGVISDTHGYLDPKVFDHFKDCDEVWHAGDIGNLEISDKLNEKYKFQAVYGNIDGHELRIQYPEFLFFKRNDVKVMMIHIGGKPPRYNQKVKKLIREYNPGILVCGHSHILKVEYDIQNKLLFMNPGAAGKHGFHKVRTLIRFSINGNKPEKMEVIELGPRSEIS